MYVISLSNISIKFEQITRFELESVQYSEGDCILCMTSCYYLLPSIHQCVVTVRSLSVLLCHRRTTFFFRNVEVAGNIETMTIYLRYII